MLYIKDNSLNLRLTLIVLIMLSGAYTFWWYSGFRALSEVVGFHMGHILLNSLLSLLFFSPVVAVAVAVLLGFFKRTSSWNLIVSIMLCGGIAGIILGESLIIIDEADFRHEAQQAQASGLDTYGRSRAWPEDDASLIWNRASSIHATD
jgi:hypothetical protein